MHEEFPGLSSGDGPTGQQAKCPNNEQARWAGRQDGPAGKMGQKAESSALGLSFDDKCVYRRRII
jgi:hypothetical protein